MTTLQVGMRVVCTDPYSMAGGQTGTVQSIFTPIVVWRLDEPCAGVNNWSSFLDALQPIEMTPEEQEHWKQVEEHRVDQERRLAYAMRYL